MKIINFVVIFIILFFPICVQAAPLWKAVFGEAVGEGYAGMYAVACCFRNRELAGMCRGSCAENKELDVFINKHPKIYRVLAKMAVKKAYKKGAKDTTKGATHFENIEAFGVPKYARNKQGHFNTSKYTITAKIGRHIFFKRFHNRRRK